MWDGDIEFLSRETGSLLDISVQCFNAVLEIETRLCGRF